MTNYTKKDFFISNFLEVHEYNNFLFSFFAIFLPSFFVNGALFISVEFIEIFIIFSHKILNLPYFMK